MYDYLGLYEHTFNDQLRRLGNIIVWEKHRTEYRIITRSWGNPTSGLPDHPMYRRITQRRCRHDLGPGGHNNVHIYPSSPVYSDSRMITDIPYMRQYGSSLKEARQITCYRHVEPSSTTTWHAWKHDEYYNTYSAPQRNIGSTRDIAPDLDGRAADGSPPPLALLPSELLDLILSFLPQDAELSLRLSCPELYHRCGSQSLFSLMYTLRVDPDPDVRRRCRWVSTFLFERFHHGTVTSTSARQGWPALPCYPCGTRHPRSFFSEDEAVKLSGRRACRIGMPHWHHHALPAAGHCAPHDWWGGFCGEIEESENEG